MERIRKLLAVAVLAVAVAPALGVGPAAAARWPHQAAFNLAYPYASQLCREVAAGQAPKPLASSSPQMTGSCAQLRTSFAAARSAYLAATAPLRRQAFTAIDQYVQICRTDRLHHDAAACGPARQAAVTTLHGLRAEFRTSARSYRSAVNSARQAFWATIRSLRGGATVTADSAAITVPASPVPPDAAVPPAGA